MSCNIDEYRHLVDGDINDHLRHQSFTDGRTVSWATEAELTAAAKWYNVEILLARDFVSVSG